MSNPWVKIAAPAEVRVLDIISEDLARVLQVNEQIKFANNFSDQHVGTSNDITAQLRQEIEKSKVKEYCDSGAIFARVKQNQLDREYDEKKRNEDAKVSVSYDNYNVPLHLRNDSDSDEEDFAREKRSCDRFETNEKENLPKRGYEMKAGEMATKHKSVINGRRNACHLVAFPPEVCTGDLGGFDIKLPNLVFNNLREKTRRQHSRKTKNQMFVRKAVISNDATAVMGGLINNKLLGDVDGIFSTGNMANVQESGSRQKAVQIDHKVSFAEETEVDIPKNNS